MEIKNSSNSKIINEENNQTVKTKKNKISCENELIMNLKGKSKPINIHFDI